MNHSRELERRIRRDLRRDLDEAWARAPQDTIKSPVIPPTRPTVSWLMAAALVATVVASGAVGSTLVGSRTRESSPAVGSPASPSQHDSPAASTDSSSACPPFAPQRLLDGGPAGVPTETQEGLFAWGESGRAVLQAPGRDALGISTGGSDSVQVRGERITAYATYVGEPSLGEVAFAFQVDNCAYTVWLPSGTPMAEAQRFIESY